MHRARQGLGPLIIALAAWCAAGTLAVVSNDSATSRIAAMGPWWGFPLAFAAAACVRGSRDEPWTAAPAALSIIPWLPLPMSPVFLIWTGHAAWVPIALAAAFAIGLLPIAFVARKLNLLEPDDATVAALVLAAAIGGLSAKATSLVPGRTPGGDEPAYLMITTSLLK